MSTPLEFVGNPQLQSLLKDLSMRASAHKRWPALGFYDRAAQLLLSQIDEPPEPVEVSSHCERTDLLRSRWFDGLCQRFFEQHPKGMCIDLQAGLSTRFHRVCATADWPRFCWVDIDASEVFALKSQLFPPTDNYRFLAGDTMSLDWLERSGWQPGTPLLVMLANPFMNLGSIDIQRLISYLADVIPRQQPVNMAFSYIKAGRFACLQKCWYKHVKQKHCPLMLAKAERVFDNCGGYQLLNDCTFTSQRSSLRWLTRGPIYNACACINLVGTNVC